jgi:class 3 adenylate cyclase/tetratricopeptide (TPR) repeat protein
VSPREERKLISILFVDQVGSTARADGADPEDVRDRNRLYYEETRARIERHGGIIEKYAGDAVMAVFGAPLARSDDAERAIRAALGILEGIRELNEHHLGLDLEVRVGVATGEAVVEIDPPPGQSLATGDVVNTAARLQTAAPPGRAIVEAETFRLTKDAIRYEELPPIKAKGKRAPVPVWLVVDAVPEIVSAAPRAPLVGRDREMLLIQTVWEGVIGAGNAHLISVLGPAGIGKSRLAREVEAEVEAGGGRVLWGRNLPYEQQTPYHAASQIVRLAAGIPGSDPVETAREKLAMLVASLLPQQESADATRYLSLLLGLGLDEPARDPFQIHFAFRRLAEELSERRPLLLVFDDLQWADDALLDLIDYLAGHLRDHRVAVMVLARPEFLESRATWGAGVLGHTSIPLNPLTPNAATDVALTLLAGDHQSTTLEKVVATAEGNPLFIEELVASIEDDPTATEVPTTVRAVIAARIDALPSEARAALLRASVIGRTFWRGVLSQIGEVADIDAALEALETRGLIQRRSPSQVEGDAEFSFKHDLIHDTAYATLPRVSRKELHAATAGVLERSVKDPSEIAWILAYHWREAGEFGRAIKNLLTAAERARDAWALEETYDLYSQALDLASTDGERKRIRLKRGLALTRLEDFGRAARELTELIPQLEGIDEIEALIARARSTLWTEQTEETIAGAQRALDLAREREMAELEAPALGLLGAAYGMRGETGDLDRAVELCNEALETWVPGTRRPELAEIYHLQGDHTYWAGTYEQAMEMAQLAQTTAGAQPGSEEFVLRGAGMQGLILAGMGRYEEAISMGQEAIAIGLRMGRPTNVVTNYSTLPLREIFAVDEAHRRSEEVADRLGPSDFNMPWMNARADLLVAEVLAGNLGQAIKQWPGVWDEALASKAWERWLVSGRVAATRAELELELGNLDDAVTWASRALEMAVATHRKKYQVVARTTLGTALARQGLAEEAVVELSAAVGGADELGSPLFRWQARAALATALARIKRGDPDGVRSEAIEIIQSVASSLTPEHRRGYLAAPQVEQVLAGAR